MRGHLVVLRVRGRDRYVKSLVIATVAVVYAAALVAAAAWWPAYGKAGTQCVGGGFCTPVSSPTLIGENGIKVLLPVSLPLLLTLLLALALWRRRRRGLVTSGALAWILTALLVAVALVGAASIGLFVLPVAVVSLASCSQFERGSDASARTSEPQSSTTLT